jgi:hypothetical protein
MKKVSSAILKAKLRLLPARSNSYKRTDKVSSDDFSTIKTLIFDHRLLQSTDVNFVLERMRMSKERIDKLEEAEKRHKVRKFCKVWFSWLLTRLSLFEAKCMNLLTIKQSDEKSTIGSMNYIEEFNSVWIISNTIMTPKIKFYYVATEFKPLSNFYNRINTACNLRKQLIESGSSLQSSAIVQQCQSSIHYITMGSSYQ